MKLALKIGSALALQLIAVSEPASVSPVSPSDGFHRPNFLVPSHTAHVRHHRRHDVLHHQGRPRNEAPEAELR